MRNGKEEEKKKQSKTEEDRIGGEDRISGLPDDILICILSLLTTQESVRCSALSHRWAPLPNLVPMKLKFVKRFYRPECDGDIGEWRKNRVPEFIRRVNQVVDSYRCETLEEFSISFDLDKYYECQITKWLQFAMANKVKKLELDFSGSNTRDRDFYQFPSVVRGKRLRSRHIGLPSCSSLTALCLDRVNVSGEQIERFLECYPLLESLCVTSSGTLTSLNVDGPVRLKFLEIQCDNLKSFVISAPNLISLKCSTISSASMDLRAPQLTEMSVGNVFLWLFSRPHSSVQMPSCSNRDSFTDRVVPYFWGKEVKWPIEIPTLSNLKQLKINFTLYHMDTGVICLPSWIKASPLLRRLVVERIASYPSARSIKPRETIEDVHQHLKEFEFVGFEGDEADTRLVLYVIENAVNLEKIVIDCRDPFHSSRKGTSRISSAKECARKFQSRIRTTVEFVLLP